MTLMIERDQEQRIRLSDELRYQQLDQVKAEIERGGSPMVLDLGELALIDVEGIRFLNTCEAAGILVRHCSAFIREWMSRERSLPTARTRKRKKRPADLEGEHGKRERAVGNRA